MRYVLARARRPLLERFARSRMLLALDYDGTLAPIVSDPERAAIPPATWRLLRRVAHVYPCAILSGRARADVARRVRGLGVLDVIGNHGVETGSAPFRADVRRRVRRWGSVLEERLEGLPGVWIENKGLSLAVHYRRSRAKAAARVRILDAAAGLDAARLVAGEQVLNVLPLGAPHKGLALERVMARRGLETALYVGDDETDEDAFALDRPGRLLTARVGPSRASQASYCLASQAEVDRLLARFVELRSEAAARRRAR